MIPEFKMPHYAQVVMVVDGAHQSLLEGKLTELEVSSMDPVEYDPKDERVRFRAKFRIGESFFMGELADGRQAVLQSSSGFHLYSLYVEARPVQGEASEKQSAVSGEGAQGLHPSQLHAYD